MRVVDRVVRRGALLLVVLFTFLDVEGTFLVAGFLLTVFLFVVLYILFTSS